MKVSKLTKTGGSRFHDVESFRIVCNDPSELEMFLSLKNANDEGLHNDEFVHVALSNMPRFRKQCVIKTNVSGTLFLKNELRAMRLLNEYPHVVQYLCHFECKDNKERWRDNLHTSRFACEANGNDMLTFIVMEYIKYGSIFKLLERKPMNKEVLYSLCLQTIYILYDLGKTYNISHGDLHTGNILIKKTKKRFMTIMNRFKIPLFGYRVVFVDFGRSYITKKPQRTSDILNDITIVLDVYRNYMKEDFPEIFNNLRNVLHQDVGNVSFGSFVEQIKECFQGNPNSH
jgi:serine/threonine protein kinase